MTEAAPARQRAESGGTLGFTQYATDSPYPAASLNFSSMLLEDPATASSEEPQPSTSRGLAASSADEAAKSKSPAKVEPVNVDENSNSNVCTVQTVSDLQGLVLSVEFV